MRINNKPFRDYYDCMHYGYHRDDVYYDRVPTVHSLSNSQLDEYHKQCAKDLEKWGSESNIINCWPLKVAVIGFCGKLYPAYYNYLSNIFTVDFRTFWVSVVDDKKVYTLVNSKRQASKKNMPVSLTDVVDHLEAFIELDSPIFVYVPLDNNLSVLRIPSYIKHDMCYYNELLQDVSLVNVTTITNINLADIEFYTQVPHWEAYQAIEVFIGNVLTKAPSITQQTDLEKRNSHGFNEQSFKRVSPGKKVRRRSNKV